MGVAGAGVEAGAAAEVVKLPQCTASSSLVQLTSGRPEIAKAHARLAKLSVRQTQRVDRPQPLHPSRTTPRMVNLRSMSACGS